MKDTEKKEAIYGNIETWETHKLLEELLQSPVSYTHLTLPTKA